jgi:hypothetical protein
VIAAIFSFLVARLFRNPITTILERIVDDDFSAGWWRYLTFVIYVVGISGGVRVWDLEKYITPRPEEAQAIVLNAALDAGNLSNGYWHPAGYRMGAARVLCVRLDCLRDRKR